MPPEDRIELCVCFQSFECIGPRRIQQTVLYLTIIEPGCDQ